MKRFLSLFLMFVMIIIPLSLPVSATAINEDEYIRFSQGNERIESNGDFTFYIHSDLMSGKFTANSDEITIEAKAYVIHKDTGKTRKTDKVTFSIALYEYGKSTAIGSFSQAANYKSNKETFAVTKNKEYYFIITISGSIDDREYVDGEGNISNITVS